MTRSPATYSDRDYTLFRDACHSAIGNCDHDNTPISAQLLPPTSLGSEDSLSGIDWAKEVE
eukprot:888290-Amphidinium_carterae.1